MSPPVLEEVDSPSRSVAEVLNSDTCSVAEDVDSVSPSVAEVEEVDWASGSEVEEGGCPGDPVCETYIR